MNKSWAKEVDLSWDRYNAQQPQCGFGKLGLCCHICNMGPCRIDPFGEGAQEGICGATMETFTARKWGRIIAAGTSAHSDHGRNVASTFYQVANGKLPGYEIKDVEKLKMIAEVYGVKVENRDKNEIARELADIILQDFGKQNGELAFIRRAPEKRQALWRKLGVVPRGIDRECVEMLHRTGLGTDQEYRNILFHGTRVALADGWGGSMIATELSDIMFGTPVPVRSMANLGVLREDQVNVIVHGHEPLLSEVIVKAAQDPKMIELAKAKGATGINIAGLCCTANEILMRHGIPTAGNFVYQELAVMTGAVEAMVVDVQCIMQGLSKIAKCFHTLLITTTSRTRLEGAMHIPYSEENAITPAEEIIKRAVDNFPNRRGVDIPQEPVDMVAGFSHEAITYLQGGRYRASYKPLNENIINGRILGVAGIVGCENPRPGNREVSGDIHIPLVKELIANDVLILAGGCSAQACAMAGLMTPESALKYAGPGLRQVCIALGIPPILHTGSCVDNSRILIAATEMVSTGGLGDDIDSLPAAGCCVEWNAEKALAIGEYFVASRIYTIFGGESPVVGSKTLHDYVTRGYEKIYGARWEFESNPKRIAELIIRHIKAKRRTLGIDKNRESVLKSLSACQVGLGGFRH